MVNRAFKENRCSLERQGWNQHWVEEAMNLKYGGEREHKLQELKFEQAQLIHKGPLSHYQWKDNLILSRAVQRFVFSLDAFFCSYH